MKCSTVGPQVLTRNRVSVDDFLRSVLSLLDTHIRQSGASISVPHEFRVAKGDATLLQVVLLKLVGTSIKFVPTGASPQNEITTQMRAATR